MAELAQPAALRVNAGDDRRLRVLYLDHCAVLSGGELALLRLLPALADVEARVILGADGPLRAKLTEAGISTEVMPLSPAAAQVRRASVRAGALPLMAVAQAVAYSVRLARHIRRLRPDLVHTNSLKSALYGGVAAVLAGVPVVWHVRDRIAEDYLPKPATRFVRLLSRAVPSAIVANSQTTLATLGRTRRLTAVVPSPVAPELWEVHAPADTSRPLRVAILGRIAPWKGQDVFLRALATAFPDGSVQGLIVGTPLFGEEGYEAELHHLARDLGVATRVQFCGFRDDVPQLLAGVDVLVHASVVAEPFGQTVVEGMAAGLAVVASGAGGPAEIIEHGTNGLLFPPGDASALSELLRRLAGDADLRRALGRQAREDARRFHPDRVAPDVLDLYRRVIAGRRRTTPTAPWDLGARRGRSGGRPPPPTAGPRPHRSWRRS